MPERGTSAHRAAGEPSRSLPAGPSLRQRCCSAVNWPGQQWWTRTAVQLGWSPQVKQTAPWRRVLAAYAGRFTAEYRAEPERLRAEATALLERLGLVETREGSVFSVRPALARYRAEVRLPEVFDV